MAEAEPPTEGPNEYRIPIKLRLMVAVLRPVSWLLHRLDQSSVPKTVPPPAPPPSQAELDRICDAYFRYHQYLGAGARGIEPPDELTDVSMMLIDLPRRDPERLWPILIELVERAPSPAIRGWIAAGLVEDLVTYHGRLFLDRLEDRAVRSRAFHEALRGIWGWERFPRPVKDRLFAVLTPEWDDLADKRAESS